MYIYFFRSARRGRKNAKRPWRRGVVSANGIGAEAEATVAAEAEGDEKSKQQPRL